MIAANAIRITPEILSPIAGVDEFKGAWRALGTLAHLASILRLACVRPCFMAARAR